MINGTTKQDYYSNSQINTIKYPEDKRSITSILWEKALKWTEEHTFKEFILLCFAIILVTLSFLAVLIPKSFYKTFIIIIQIYDYAILKIIILTVILWRFTAIIRILTFIYRFIIGTKNKTQNVDHIEGIPKIELLDHLFMEKSFKLAQVNAKWQLSRKKYDRLASKLEEIDVLVRGENNARVLNPKFSRSDIKSILEGVKKSKEVEGLFRPTQDGKGATTRPSVSEIKDRINNTLHSDR